jgi:hypothetical protein
LTQRDTAAAAAAAAAAVVADVSISVAAIHPKAMQLQFGAGRNVCPIRIRKQLRYTRKQDIRTVRYSESQHIWTVRIFEQSGHTHSLASWVGKDISTARQAAFKRVPVKQSLQLQVSWSCVLLPYPLPDLLKSRDNHATAETTCDGSCCVAACCCSPSLPVRLVQQSGECRIKSRQTVTHTHTS